MKQFFFTYICSAFNIIKEDMYMYIISLVNIYIYARREREVFISPLKIVSPLHLPDHPGPH